MPSSALLSFRSSLFPIARGEDAETNPGIFGRSLAVWIGQRLVSPAFAASDVVAEDFGWCVPIPNQPLSVYVACSSIDEDLDPASAASSAAVEWRVFVIAEGAWVGRLLGRVNLDTVVQAVFGDLRRLLEGTPGIDDLREET